MTISLKRRVINLAAAGYSREEISLKLKCSRTIVNRYLRADGCKRALISTSKWISKLHPAHQKLKSFTKKRHSQRKRYSTKSKEIVLYFRIRAFMKVTKNPTYTIQNIKLQDVLDKFGPNPKCYLTGDSIDLNDASKFAFDHIHPASRGGPSTLDNLGLTSPITNMSKTNQTVEEYLELCAKVLRNFGYKVTRDVDKIKPPKSESA